MRGEVGLNPVQTYSRPGCPAIETRSVFVLQQPGRRPSPRRWYTKVQWSWQSKTRRSSRLPVVCREAVPTGTGGLEKIRCIRVPVRAQVLVVDPAPVEKCPVLHRLWRYALLRSDETTPKTDLDLSPCPAINSGCSEHDESKLSFKSWD